MQKSIAFFLLITLTLFSIIVHFLWLDKFPVGLNHDETDVVLSAKSYWQNGTDISGVKFPLSLVQTKTEAGLSGLPSILLAPIIGPLPTNLITARIPFVLINILTGFFLSGIIFKLTKNKFLSFLTFTIFLVNPWSFLYSRATTEAPFALLFILIGIFSLIKSSGFKIFYSLIFFLLAFMSYFGGKPIILVLVPLLLITHYFSTKKNLKLYILYLLTFFVFVGGFFLIATKLPNSTYTNRSSEVTLSNINRFQPEVQDSRKQSIENPFNNLFINKDVLLLNQLLVKYTGWLSPDYLFFNGDPRATYRLANHGVIYMIDGLFIILGLIGLTKLKGNILLKAILSILFIVAPVSATLSNIETSYFFRTFLLIPVIVLLISFGINFIYGSIKFKNLFLVVVTIFYSLAFINFLHFYFFQYPVTQQENQFLSERILTNYLQRANTDSILVVQSPLQINQQYMFFTNTNKPNLNFSDNCNEATNSSKVVIIGATMKCSNLPKSFHIIQNQKDAGTIFRIFNDKLCQTENLSRYRRSNFLKDYSVESLSNAEFCDRWVGYE